LKNTHVANIKAAVKPCRLKNPPDLLRLLFLKFCCDVRRFSGSTPPEQAAAADSKSSKKVS
jgi:hypothetical protein